MRVILLIALFLSVSLAAAEYRVQSGDTLSKIAQDQLGDPVKWKNIAELNGISEPFTVKIGQLLQMPEVDSLSDEHDSIDEILSTPQEPEENIQITWMFILIGFIVSWLYWSLCLKAGCWFSLVEMTWKKSMLFPLFMIAGVLLLAAVFVYFPGRRAEGDLMEAGKFFKWALISMGLCMAITVVFLKRYLECKWRSVLTVLVMTSVLANALSILTMLLLSYTLPGLDALKQMMGYFQY